MQYSTSGLGQRNVKTFSAVPLHNDYFLPKRASEAIKGIKPCWGLKKILRNRVISCNLCNVSPGDRTNVQPLVDQAATKLTVFSAASGVLSVKKKFSTEHIMSFGELYRLEPSCSYVNVKSLSWRHIYKGVTQPNTIKSTAGIQRDAVLRGRV